MASAATIGDKKPIQRWSAAALNALPLRELEIFARDDGGAPYRAHRISDNLAGRLVARAYHQKKPTSYGYMGPRYFVPSSNNPRTTGYVVGLGPPFVYEGGQYLTLLGRPLRGNCPLDLPVGPELASVSIGTCPY
jgi:hypothetical protein